MFGKCTFSITFYCRESKVNKQGFSPLEVGININQQRLFLNLPIKFQPKDFNKRKRGTDIENVLSAYRVKVNEVMAHLLNTGVPITAHTLREYLKSGGVKSKTLSDLIREFNISINKKLSSVAIKKYELTEAFLVSHFGENREISTITYEDFLLVYKTLKEKYLLSTAGGYMTRTKSIIQFGVDKGYIKNNPINSIKISKGISTISYLRNTEIEAIKALDLADYPRLEKVRDLALFQLSVGTAYIDLVSFGMDKVQTYDGVSIYSNKRIKTGVQFSAVILPLGMEVLKKYDGKLPLLSNQKYNQYLKEIGRLANINSVITTHILRKTYATLLLNAGVGIEVVAKSLGHADIRTTQKSYAKVLDEYVVEQVSKAFHIV